MVKSSLLKDIIIEDKIKGSRFICQARAVKSIIQAKEFINEVKQIHSQATHNCSAYIVGNFSKVDDDGEPNKTAGVVILNVLLKQNITNICVVVTRYFGGTKLGVGGLIRAYSNITSKMVQIASLGTVLPGYKCRINLMYKDITKVEYILKQYQIKVVKKDFNYQVEFIINCLVEDYIKLEEEIKNNNHLNQIIILNNIEIIGEENGK